MKIGIISDIHGNLHALDAVLDALEAKQVGRIVCVGDLVGYGAHPNEVIGRLREREIPCVLGNYDAGVVQNWDSPSRKPSSPRNQVLKEAALQWAKEQLSEDHKNWLKDVPWTVAFSVGQSHIQMIHAGLDFLDEWIGPDTPEMEALAGRVSGEVVLLGHTHMSFITRMEQTLFVNPGAVGRALDLDTRAAYAVFDSENKAAELLRVAYDVEAAAQAIEQTSMPQQIADLVRYGIRRIDDLNKIKQKEKAL